MSREIPTFTVYLDKKCAECGKPGAYDNGLCGACTTRAIQNKSMRTQVGKAVQVHARKILDRTRKP